MSLNTRACAPDGGKRKGADVSPEQEAGPEQPNHGWAGFHKCAVTGCTAQILLSKLICGRHWKLLRYNLALKIWLAEKGHGVGSVEYKTACREAVAFLTDRAKSGIKS